MVRLLIRRRRCTDLAFEDDADALLQLRRFMGFLPSSNREQPPIRETKDPSERPEPSLDTLVPANPNKPYDMKELIEKIVDEGEFFELQPAYEYRHRLCAYLRATSRNCCEPTDVLAGCSRYWIQRKRVRGLFDL